MKKQLLHAPKYYLFDCGALNAINGYLRIDLRPSSFLYGKLFENFIVTQLRAANDYQDLGLKFFYWRDKNGAEVDLLLARNVMDPVVAIEIKSASAPDSDDCSGFRSLADDYPNLPRVCICTTPRAYLRDGILFTPWQDALTDIMKVISACPFGG